MSTTTGIDRRRETAEGELPWDERILRVIDAGVDPTLIAENLRRSPTERLERLQQAVSFILARRRERHQAPP